MKTRKTGQNSEARCKQWGLDYHKLCISLASARGAFSIVFNKGEGLAECDTRVLGATALGGLEPYSFHQVLGYTEKPLIVQGSGKGLDEPGTPHTDRADL
jgi:hypothetical protein